MVGGEYPIAVTDILNASTKQSHLLSDIYFYSSGRAALYQILKFLKNNKNVTRILLPDYLCSSILVPINRLKLEYEFYPLNYKLELDENSFLEVYKKFDVVLIINYFGLQDLSNSVSIIKRIDKNAIIIEDDVQAYFEFKKPIGNVDFKFTSLRKTFAVPDGGLVKTSYKLPRVEISNTFGQYKAAAALLKSMREGNFNDCIYLELFKKAEDLIDDELECSMSYIAEKLFFSLDDEHVKMRRMNNAYYLEESLKNKGISILLPLNDNKVPLFLPIFLKNRDEVRKRMYQNEVFCPIHWPLDGLNIKCGAEMAKHELSLIIDQRYGLNEMDLILSLL